MFLYIYIAIARVALDQKLGCFEDEHTVDSDTQNLIDAINIFFANVPELELKIPFWKLFSTPTWRKYIKALDTITKYKESLFKSKLTFSHYYLHISFKKTFNF